MAEEDDAERRWNMLVEDLAEGRVPVLDVLRAGSAELVQEGDHQGFIAYTRSYHVLMENERILQRFHAEVTQEAAKHVGGAASEITRKVSSRDGPRLFKKLGATQSQLFADGPSLLSAGNL